MQLTAYRYLLLWKGVKVKPRIKKPYPDIFKEQLIEGAQFSPKYEFPLLKKVTSIPERAVPFDKANRRGMYDHWVHFYIYDHRFQCLWHNPRQYLNMLKRFAGVITPDFSLYRCLPLAMQIWNTYRNRALAFWMQNNGINIVPNVRWGDERSYNFAFEGLEPGGSVAISTYGAIKSPADRYYFKEGLKKMVERLNPQTVINYSRSPEDIFAPYKKLFTLINLENDIDTIQKGAQ